MKDLTLQLLVAAVGRSPRELAEEMRIDSDAIIVSQGEHYGYEEIEWKNHTLRYFAMAERGVGIEPQSQPDAGRCGYQSFRRRGYPI